MIDVLAAVTGDARQVITTLRTAGVPEIGDGRQLAAAMAATFDEIEKSDAAWRSELRAGIWAWPASSASRAKRDRVRTSLEALLLVGRQIARLPHNQERQNAMAHSPVCRDVFGTVRVDRQTSS
jgi:hypothetical protein